MSFERIRRRITFPPDSVKEVQKLVEKQKIQDPKIFSKFVGLHKGESFVVCGCGNSLKNYESFDSHIAIGVNDASSRIPCKYLVVVNEPRNFARGRWENVENTDAEYVFTHIPTLPIPNSERRVIINLGKYEGVNLDNYGFIDYTTNSPYMAIIIAYQMGARKIAIVGVDFTLHHFFGETGKHKINREIDKVLNQYSVLGRALTDKGISIANLSQESMIESWPKMTLEEFETI